MSAETAIKTAKKQLADGTTPQDAVNKLIDDSQDVLLKALDKKVSVRALQFVVSMY